LSFGLSHHVPAPPQGEYTGDKKKPELVCQQPVSSVKNKYRPAAKSNVSSTHGANSWSYPNQTNVQVIRSHQEIKAAMEKRRLLAKSVVQVIA